LRRVIPDHERKNNKPQADNFVVDVVVVVVVVSRFIYLTKFGVFAIVAGTGRSQQQYNIVNRSIKDSEIFQMAKFVAPICVSRQKLFDATSDFNKKLFQTF
jgi:hypothetical protein